MLQTALKTHDDFVADGHTPMMAQYLAVKARYPDCLVFYRMGDFFEMFFEDAIKASETLDITLTRRGKTQGDEIPMCGVPAHSFDAYLARLIRSGFKVAICDQTETPEQAKKRGGSKALVQRDVIRVVTQGTLTEDTLLDARENNYLSALAETGGQYGLAWMELSTGDFWVQAVAENSIGASIERIGASEILASDRMIQKEGLFETFNPLRDRMTIQPASLFDSENARKRLEALFSVGTLDSFGAFSRAEIAAAGALVDYVERTQVGKLPHLFRPRQLSSGGMMEIDAATRRNLELARTLSGERKGSLLATIDCTVTAPGARLLQARLSAPLCDLNAIHQRHDEIETLIDDAKLRHDLRLHLKSVPDMERALSRLTVGRGGPRDLGQIRDGLQTAEDLRAVLLSSPSPFRERAGVRDTTRHDADTTFPRQNPLSEIISGLQQQPSVQSLCDRLRQCLSDDLPFSDRDGGFIREGYSARLDELRIMKNQGKRLIAELEAKYKQDTGIDSLKIAYNNILGFYIDVPAKRADRLMVRPGEVNRADNPFIHRQTMASAVRFTTPELAEMERDMASATDKALAIEQELFDQISDEISALSPDIGAIARALAALDVAGALAHLAAEYHYVRPVMTEGREFSIASARHPVVEAALRGNGGDVFVPNDCNLGDGQRLWLLTGPNMAGKSTFLRQNALIAIMAQMGSFVPAESATIGLIDRLFSRVGASDDLARGHSTFMVEMVETAAILNQATSRSLVILDEIGRGTATFDGLSIAWACVEHLHDVNACRSLFATHYHELTSLTAKLPALSCHSMQVKEWKGDIIFMHTVAEGSADRSYGIHVARLAGLPAAVIARAQAVLALLQSGEKSGALARLADDLPLFNAAVTASPAKTSPVLEKLQSVNPDSLSPKEALDILYQLKALQDS
jgi:DNA mismatch repair protein MutS